MICDDCEYYDGGKCNKGYTPSTTRFQEQSYTGCSRYEQHSLTVHELIRVLEKIEQDGYGDYNVCFEYDGGHAYTSTNGKYTVHSGDVFFGSGV